MLDDELNKMIEEATADARGIATSIRNWYTAFTSVGFTEDQAMDLTKELLRLAIAFGQANG